MKQLDHIDLFAGIGGFALGLERVGIRTLAHVEIDTACQGVLRRHWPGHLILSDVKEAGAHNLPYADIITFGSPCQDLSIAGERAGLEGERSGLFHAAIRIIREIKPRIAIWENVPGAFSSNRGGDFRTVVAEMLGSDVPMPRSGRWATAGVVRTGEIEVAWRVLDAQYAGVAQRRRRVFVVRSVGEPSASAILFEREGMRWNPPTRGKAGQENSGVVGTLSSSASGAERPAGQKNELDFCVMDARNGADTEDVTMTLQAKESGGYSLNSIPLIAFNGDRDGLNSLEDLSPTLTHKGSGEKSHGAYPKVSIAFGGNNTAGPIDVATAQNAHGGTGRCDFESETFVAVARPLAFGKTTNHQDESQQTYVLAHETGKGFWTEGMPGLRSQPGGMPENILSNGIGVRRLTPTECEKLQGFPPGWTEVSDKPQADSPRYKQLGNAVCVNVIEWIGKRIVTNFSTGESQDAN